jgi:uncharacterized protein YciI
MSEVKHFLGIIKPTRDDFMTNSTEEDNRIMSEHFQYLKQLLKQKKLILAGPVLNELKPQGIYIFECESIEEARELIEADPAIKADIQQIVLLEPFKISLLRKD